MSFDRNQASRNNQQPAEDNPIEYITRTHIQPSQVSPLTRNLPVDQLDIDTYHNTRDQWIKVNTFYECPCGRYVGYFFQQSLVQPIPPNSAQLPRVIDLNTPPVIDLNTPPPPNQTAITVSSGNDSIVSISSTTSSNLLVELPNQIERFGPEFSPNQTNVSMQSTLSVERMSVDANSSLWSDEA